MAAYKNLRWKAITIVIVVALSDLLRLWSAIFVADNLLKLHLSGDVPLTT